MSKIYHINDLKSANDYIVEKRIDALTADLEILKMNSAEVLDKLNILLQEKQYKNHLTEDQEIDFGVLKVKVERFMNDIDEVIKKI
jgi:uncharacterized protein YoxC